jgi:hypothetical protein
LRACKVNVDDANKSFRQNMLMITKAVSDSPMIHRNFQVIEIKPVSMVGPVAVPKKGGRIFEGMSTEVIENTYRKNVRFWV